MKENDLMSAHPCILVSIIFHSLLNL